MSIDGDGPITTANFDAPTINGAALAYVRSGPKALFIDGRWKPAQEGETFEVFNPSTGKVIVQVALADAKDVDDAVKAARKAFQAPSWARISPHQRSALSAQDRRHH